jgi:chromosome segregation ATPase
MSDSIKINALEVENLKRVQAVTLTPSPSGLTIMGGGNGQGKTSVLNSIMWALGGDRYRPDNYRREGASGPTRIKLTLSNGLVVERSGKNGALKVTDPAGVRHGQQLLNDFVEELALNLPKFLQSSEKEKADTLLQIIGVGPQLLKLEQEHSRLYQERLYTGQEQRKAAAHAESLPEVPGAPEEEISPMELIQKQQAILLQNEENRRKRNRLEQMQRERESIQEQIDLLTDQLRTLDADLEVARTDAADLEDQSTAELEENLRNIEETNKAFYPVAEKLYKQSAPQGDPNGGFNPGAGFNGGPNGKPDDGVVDADFEEVKD